MMKLSQVLITYFERLQHQRFMLNEILFTGQTQAHNNLIRNPFKLTVMLMLCTARLMTYLVLYYTDHTSAALDMF